MKSARFLGVLADRPHPSSPTARPSITVSPKASTKARNDGQRWRWALAQAAEADPGLLNTARVQPGRISCSTSSALKPSIGHDVAGFGRGSDRGSPRVLRPYALDTLKDEETIARLATGIKRFKLPDEFNPIKIYQAIADEPKTGHGEVALECPGDHLREPSPVRPAPPSI